MTVASLNETHLSAILNWRYAVKKFDATKKIDASTWDALESSLVMTPSSFGLQPWKFIVVSSPEIKAKLPAVSWNQSQPADCSHMVVMAARKQIDVAYLDRFIQRIAAVRSVPSESLEGYRQVILGFINNSAGRHLAWSSNQAYIALGQLMTVAASLGVDACPMEGIVASEYDKVLGLEGSEYQTVVGCALGYRHPDDKYAEAKKVRFEASDVIVHL
jgi:nitroreductase